MLFLYNTGIYSYTLLVRIASFKNKKAAAWIKGRKGLLELIEKSLDKSKRYTWFHFASLGEFEQGSPVIEKLKSENPEFHVLITFFSPSGYEIRKNYALADYVFYLPIDTKTNAIKFIRLINPVMAVFTKYEYWYHYFEELSKNNIPLYVISGRFRKEQIFFKWYGGLHRKILSKVSHFFVQNQFSSELLKDIGLKNVTVNGDTRFDRVAFNVLNVKAIKIIADFSAGSKVFIGGSTWPEDEKLIATLVDNYPDWKFIIAPHEVKPERIKEIATLFPNSIRYSEINNPQTISEENQKLSSNFNVLIIDNIGLLSSAYQYGEIAYIGGGFGVGIHNTLEAVAFGLAVIFGPNYQKFPEAIELISIGVGFSIKNSNDLADAMETLKIDSTREYLAKTAREYVESHTGATQTILDYIRIN
jgi:3-deoxy-D-manno-octulosonic-acid transferase